MPWHNSGVRMADFCKQCSIEIFGEDFRELAASDGHPLPPGHGYLALCEGCGMTVVDSEGRCVSTECEKHGDANVSDNKK